MLPFNSDPAKVAKGKAKHDENLANYLAGLQ